jgi:hypothetical protein
MMVTKRTRDDAKPAKPVTTGRPSVGERPMSDAERQRRRRARKRQAAKPVRDANEIFEALCESRNLTSAFDRRLAEAVTDSLCSGNLAEAVRGMALLPPIVRAEGAPTMSATDARAKVLALVMNAKAAWLLEAGLTPDDEYDIERLREKVFQLQAELRARRGASAPAVEPVAAPAMPEPDMTNVTPLRPEPKAEPKGAAAAAPVEPVTPLPEPTQSWDSTPGGKAWHTWRNNGGYSNGDPFL